MKIYSVSILFWAQNITKNYPMQATSNTFTDLENFLNGCVLEVQQDALFNLCNVSITAVQSRILDDGFLFKELEKEIVFRNYKPITLKNHAEVEPVINKSGIAVRELKEWVMNLPEVDRNGQDYEVWISEGIGFSSIATEIAILNEGDVIICRS